MQETSNEHTKKDTKRQSVTFTKQRGIDLQPADIAKAYAWRTNHRNLRTLSAYEFVRRFEVIATKPPPRVQTETQSETKQLAVHPFVAIQKEHLEHLQNLSALH